MVTPIRQNLAVTAVLPSVELVTPSLATAWLNTMVRNRPLSRISVNKYKADMAANRWQFTGEAIKFDIDGHLIDGQHRLTALSELPPNTLGIQMLVLRGIAPEAQMSMDQGRKRSSANQLAMIGVKDATIVAAGARLYLMLQTGMMFRDSNLAQETVTTAAIEEWSVANGTLIDTIGEFLTWVKRTNATPSVSYCAAIIFTAINPDMAREFFRGLSKGAGGEQHPITVLDKKLAAIRRSGSRLPQRDELALFISAWNAWRQGKQVRSFQMRKGGWTPESFPKAVAA